MHHVWMVLIALMVFALLLQLVSRRSSNSWPVLSRPVMTEAERKLYARLLQAFPDRLVFPQVQLCRFVEVKKVERRYEVLNRYNRLSADFVLCRSDSVVELVVELDDRSHDRAEARSRDARKDTVLRAAGIRLVRVHARSLPTVDELKSLLFPGEGIAAPTTQPRQRA